MSAGQETYSRLREEIARLPLVDTHEHTKSERFRIENPFSPANLGYVGCDLCAAGASTEESEAVENAVANPRLAREVILRYWPHTRTTGYGRSIERTLQGVFGIDRLDERSYDRLAENIRSGISEGCYEKWFRGRYNIQAVILDADSDDDYPPFFYRSLRHGKYFVLCDSRPALEALEERTGRSIHSAAQLRDAMWSYLETLMERLSNVVSLKNNLAYNRSIYFERTTLADADRAFDRLFGDKYPRHATSWINAHYRSYEELAPLQNFLVHETVRFAQEHDLAYQLHTGLQAGYTNRLPDSRPTDVINLLSEYRKVRFVLFHGGFPWCREWGVLGKNFPNVWLDLCWLHIISPTTTVNMLDEWLDYVPSNKLFAFGGDLHMVESIYGHLEIARDNLARALAVKVDRGDFDAATALTVARKMLLDNPDEVFRLGLSEK
ncbi:MAG TPA: amidohydrolase family protein [Candidatus Glassbacteria bacterium]|nr:amidohydrolase family protein [Candidatus Glassbacteria bacterium]